MNREQWLTEVALQAQRLFVGFAVAPYRVTCGWPCKNATGASGRRVGECHAQEASKGKVHEIFISPLLDDPAEVAGVLTHEMAHVVAGIKAGHGKEFLRVAHHVGLTKGRPRSIGPGEQLEGQLRKITSKLGPYPHQALLLYPREKKEPSTVILQCACGCKVTMGKKWLDEPGLPTCACGLAFREVE